MALDAFTDSFHFVRLLARVPCVCASSRSAHLLAAAVVRRTRTPALEPTPTSGYEKQPLLPLEESQYLSGGGLLSGKSFFMTVR